MSALPVSTSSPPRWEALTDPMIWIWAMGQAFFSLSVTGSGMIVYGAYLSKDEDVVDVAQHTALFDTIAAVVALPAALLVAAFVLLRINRAMVLFLGIG